MSSNVVDTIYLADWYRNLSTRLYIVARIYVGKIDTACLVLTGNGGPVITFPMNHTCWTRRGRFEYIYIYIRYNFIVEWVLLFITHYHGAWSMISGFPTPHRMTTTVQESTNLVSWLQCPSILINYHMTQCAHSVPRVIDMRYVFANQCIELRLMLHSCRHRMLAQQADAYITLHSKLNFVCLNFLILASIAAEGTRSSPRAQTSTAPSIELETV